MHTFTMSSLQAAPFPSACPRSRQGAPSCIQGGPSCIQHSLCGSSSRAVLWRMHTLLGTMPAQHMSCRGMYDGLTPGQQLLDECNALDLAAIKRLEERFARGLNLQVTPEPAEDGPVELHGPPRAAHLDGMEGGEGVSWNRDREEYTDEELWEEIGNEIPAMWDTNPDVLPDDITIIAPPPGSPTMQEPSEFMVVSRPDGKAVVPPPSQPTQSGHYVVSGPHGNIIMQSLPPIVIKLDDIPDPPSMPEGAKEGETSPPTILEASHPELWYRPPAAVDRDGGGQEGALDESTRGWGDTSWPSLLFQFNTEEDREFFEAQLREQQAEEAALYRSDETDTESDELAEGMLTDNEDMLESDLTQQLRSTPEDTHTDGADVSEHQLRQGEGLNENIKEDVTAVDGVEAAPPQDSDFASTSWTDNGADARALVGLPYPTRRTSPPSVQEAFQMNVVLGDADVEAGRQDGYWTMRMQQLGVLDEAGAVFRSDDPRKALAAARAVFNAYLQEAKHPDVVLQIYRDLGPLLDASNLADAVYQLSNISDAHMEWASGIATNYQYQALLAQLQPQISSLSPKRLCNVACAFASLKDAASLPIMQDIANHLAVSNTALKLFSRAEISRLMQACGVRKVNNKVLFQRVTSQLLHRGLHTMQAKNIGNVLWAFARLEFQDAALAEAAGLDLMTRLEQYPPGAISRVVWAMGVLGMDNVDTLQALCPRLSQRLPEFIPIQLSFLLVGLSKLGIVDPNLIQGILAACCASDQWDAMDDVAVISMAQALAMLGYREDSWTITVCVRMGRRASKLSAEDIQSLLSTMATLDLNPGATLLKPLLARLDELVEGDEVGNARRATLLSSIAMLCGSRHPLLEKILQQPTPLFDEDSLSDDAMQLFMVLLLSHAECALATDKPRSLLSMVPSDVAQRCYQQWKAAAAAAQRNELHTEVCQHLTALGIPYVNDYLSEGGLFAVDIAIVGGSKKVAIEVDGPSRFTVNTLQPTGESQLRYKMLQALGWHVISVPFYDWARLAEGKGGKMQYLAHKLAHLDQYTGPPAPPPVQVGRAVLQARMQNTLTQSTGLCLVGIPLHQDAASVLGLRDRQTDIQTSINNMASIAGHTHTHAADEAPPHGLTSNPAADASALPPPSAPPPTPPGVAATTLTWGVDSDAASAAQQVQDSAPYIAETSTPQLTTPPQRKRLVPPRGPPQLRGTDPVGGSSVGHKATQRAGAAPRLPRKTAGDAVRRNPLAVTVSQVRKKSAAGGVQQSVQAADE